MRGLKIALMLVGLLAIIQQSEQFNLKKVKLVSQEPKSNLIAKKYICLVFSSYSTEKAFNESGFFTFQSSSDYLGRRIVTGTVYPNYPVAYTTSASNPSIHVGIAVNIFASYFEPRGIIYVGAAGTTNDSISIGSVVVPKQITFAGAWDWLSNYASEKGELIFGQYNYPTKGEHLLGSLDYKKSYIYNGGIDGTKFWIPVDNEWLWYATQVEIDEADIIVGLNGSSSDIYISNLAYREFLYKTFRVSTVDTCSAAAAFGALASDLKFIAFEGISNKAGASSGKSKSALANANAVKVLNKFIQLILVPRAQHEYWI